MENKCFNCGHSEEDHTNMLCYWAENQGYQEDLCPCPGFNVKTDQVSYLATLFSKAGVTCP